MRVAFVLSIFLWFLIFLAVSTAFASGWRDELGGSHLDRWEAAQQRTTANTWGTREQYAPPPDYTRGLNRPTDWEELLHVPGQPRVYVPDNRRWENGQ
jgi:hypothetical protein